MSFKHLPFCNNKIEKRNFNNKDAEKFLYQIIENLQGSGIFGVAEFYKVANLQGSGIAG